MIKAFVVRPGYVGFELHNLSPRLFIAVKNLLKEKGCHWEQALGIWTAPLPSFDTIQDAIGELDTLEVAPEVLDPSQWYYNPELQRATIRNAFNLDHLRYPPLIGKPPYENFQKIDILRALNQNRFGFFWDMGTGKSYATSSLIAHYYGDWKKVKRILLITTNIGTKNLRGELLKFLKIPHIDTQIKVITSKEKECFHKDAPDILIMSYDTFRTIANFYKKKLNIKADMPKKPFIPIDAWLQGQDAMLLLDESHNIGNPQSLQSKYITLHAPYFAYRYIFSGTPADKPEKLYNQFKLLDSALVHHLPYSQWLSVYADIGNRFSAYAINGWHYEKLERLNKKFNESYGMYRASKDVIELPPNYVKKLYIDMHPHHRSIYEGIVENKLKKLQEEHKTQTRDIINTFPYVSLSLDNPLLLEKHIPQFPEDLQERILTFNIQNLEKYSVLQDILDEHPNEKGILWVVHPLTAHTLAQQFRDYNPIVITGQTPEGERAQLLEQFEKGNHQILIANIKVLNTSVTLTFASWQCYVERLYQYTAYEQSTRRIHRFGQTKPIITYILIYRKSLDMFMDKNLDTKGVLVQSLVSREFLTQEEWAQLFNMQEYYEEPIK